MNKKKSNMFPGARQFADVDYSEVEKRLSGLNEQDSKKLVEWINEAETSEERTRRKNDAFATLYGSTPYSVKRLLGKTKTPSPIVKRVFELIDLDIPVGSGDITQLCNLVESLLEAADAWKEYDDHTHNASLGEHTCSNEPYGVCMEAARLWNVQRLKLIAVLKEARDE
jgi:hypothetical protein